MSILDERDTAVVRAREAAERRALLVCLESDFHLMDLIVGRYTDEPNLNLGGWLHFAVFVEIWREGLWGPPGKGRQEERCHIA